MKISIRCDMPELMADAELLASQHDFALNESAECYLWLTVDGLQLQHGQFNPLRVDFVGGKLGHRLKQAGKNQAIAKACLIKIKPKILDLTAGWGRDAALLASLGAKVVMLERNPVQALLLNDGLKRLQQCDRSLSLELIQTDAMTYLFDLDETTTPDIIYFDPMHPARTKSALVKKEMQVLQALVGEDCDQNQVAMMALTKARKRLVIKWPQSQVPLLPQKPALSFSGKTIRYDVYFVS